MAIIEARPDATDRDTSRAAFAAKLGEVNGVSVVSDERAAALAGNAADADDTLAASALAEARDGFGALDCGRARPAAEDAVRLLAGRAAGGLDEAVRLRAAWTYVLLCADRDGDGPMARAAADRLRGLGGSPAVPGDVWVKYPEIDAATDRDIVELKVTAPVGAAVTVDHVAVGIAPVTTFVAAGKHVVAVASGTTRGAAFVTAHGKPLSFEVTAADRASPWRAVAGQVAAWQGAAPPSVVEVTELMTQVKVRFAVVLGERNTAALWVRAPDESAAKLVIDGVMKEPLELGAGVMARVEAWSGGSLDPDKPLTATDELVREVSRPQNDTRWWVYAVIGGALAAGAVTIYAIEAGEDRQVIDLDF
ncbi:MAG TPA: PEGA domain-containing protein [Kofleriaceae bacterium]|nr:PEGA domain-containing protein [Kofleriaceae bacterium]